MYVSCKRRDIIEYVHLLRKLISLITNLSEKKKDLIVVFLFFIITAVYFFPMFRGLILLPLDLLISSHGPWYSQAAISVKNSFLEDSIIQMYPWRYIVFTALNNGIIPFWNPYTLMGTPFMASMKPMVFYPFTLLLFKSGPIYGWNILLFLQVFLSLVFTYLFLRSFQLSRLISIFGSLVYSLNSLMMGVLSFGSEGHVLLWFPLLFFAIKKFIDTKSWWTLPILSVAIGSSILAGQLQYFIYHSIAVISFAVFYGYLKKISFSSSLLLFTAFLCGIGISAVQLVPSLELLSYANRSTEGSLHQFLSSLLQPVHFLRFFSPDFFGNPVKGDYKLNYIEGSGYFGIIPLFFIFYALFFIKYKKTLLFFLLMAGAGLLLSLEFIGKYLPYTHIQLLYFGAGYRVFSLVYLPAALLSALGLLYFIRSDNYKIKKLLLLFSLLVIIIFGIVYFFQNAFNAYAVTFTNIYFQLLIFSIFVICTIIYLVIGKRFIFGKYIFIGIIIALTFFDLFRMGYRFLPYTHPVFLYPSNEVVTLLQKQTQSTLDRSYGLFDPEVAPLFSLSTPEIYNPLYLQRSRQTMDALISTDTNSLDFTSSYFLFRRYGNNLKNAMDVLGVRYLIVGMDHNPSTELFHTEEYEKVFNPTRVRFEKYDVYTNPQAYPRFGIYYSAVTASDDNALRMLKEKKIDLQKTLILEKDRLSVLEQGIGTTTLQEYSYNTAKFTVETDKRGYFYLSDTYYPGWKAYINKNEVPIIRANANFRAILLPTGKSEVMFVYLPTYFYLGVTITLISLLLTFIVPFIYLKARRLK